ncbi:hypothetical protein OZX67_09260 [Bifidobacterium sp. ESL0728]|uniref:hypothetical protein n=1 Tax=Bifidobacterium sp. ESL0728 TaxID=2983220 RepID=UPI0023F77606|nr:hypothetical protein [Bifidobacterium sp. ESL0728]WEV58956.1 hypothetical protein OZX67_09260 [Bifidobacterium sp. ESL0728]
MNKSNQSESSRHNGRRLSLVVGILVSVALMAGPLMTFADDSTNNANSQATDAQTSTQNGQQPADGQAADPKGGVSAATPGLGGKEEPKSQTQIGGQSPSGQSSTSGEDATTQQQSGSAQDATGGTESESGPKSYDDPQPQLAKMLAYNKQVDVETDEMRMDFVLKVKTGAVNPNCNVNGHNYGIEQWDKEGNCGLQLYYSDGTLGTRDLNNKDNDKLTQLIYINTLGTSSDNPQLKKQAAAYWARNWDQFFTIHSINTVDGFDYISISAEGDVDYAPELGSKTLGGRKLDRELYAVVGRNVRPDNCGNAQDQYCQIPATTLRNDKKHAVNVAANYPVYLYSTGCDGDNCAGPISYVGWNQMSDTWSYGQSNWGMHLDNGFTTSNIASKDFWKDGLLSKDVDPGIAPTKSFFVYWNNPGYQNGKCGTTTSFYYEWFGRKDGNWVPATSINSHALVSNGQVASGPSVSASPKNYAASFNQPNDINNDNPDRTIMGDGPAQNQDGSINFQKAKDDQGLDGYFKLVTWPISTNKEGNPAACIATDKTGDNNLSKRDVYNPLYGGEEQGVTLDMAQHHQDQAQYLMNLGWTVDTAFDGFSYSENPTADSVVPAAPPEANKHDDTPSLTEDDHKPVINQMLAYNDKVDSEMDELRADFVLRVGHGDVNPGCIRLAEKYPSGKSAMVNKGEIEDGDQGVDSTGECGLKLTYRYSDIETRPTRYINTLDSNLYGTKTNHSLQRSAFWWAKDVGIGAGGEKGGFTIRDIKSDGKYDYLTISMEGDVDYPNPSQNKLGGTQRDLSITAQTGKDLQYTNDLTKNDYKLHLYANGAKHCGDKPSSQCDGPSDSMAYDQTHPVLWSGGEANWGLTVDKGFHIPQQEDIGTGASVDNGIAPANSFSARWYNPDYQDDDSNLCNQVKQYYYQWFALSNGHSWVPVQELTPKAQKTDQPYIIPEAFTIEKTDAEDGARVNTPGNGKVPYRGHLSFDNLYGGLMASGSAQQSDGSINFGAIKAVHPDYNGYFKMVTWPISTNSRGDNSSCVAGNGVSQDVEDVYNPLQQDPDGAQPKMSQEKIKDLINKGWPINTVYDDYSYSTGIENDSQVKITKVTAPHTTFGNNGELASNDTLTVEGTDTGRHFDKSTVNVYAVYTGQGQNQGVTDNDLSKQATDKTLLGSTNIDTTNDSTWQVTVDKSKIDSFFMQHVKDSQNYRFIAIDSSYGLPSPPAHLDTVVDMTSSDVAFKQVSYKAVTGTVTSKDVNSPAGSKVIVIWDTGASSWSCSITKTGENPATDACKTSETTADKDGNWSIKPPTFVDRRTVKAYAIDSAGNESALADSKVPLPRPVRHLPLTGSWMLWLLLAIVVLVMAELAYRYYKKHGQRQAVTAGRHNVSSSGGSSTRGPRHKV